MGKRGLRQKRKKIVLISVCAVITLTIVLFFAVFWRGADNEKYILPTLTVETPQKISLSDTEIFSLDVLISSLGESIYPAASMILSFDPSRLEFLGVGEGNVFVSNYDVESNVKQKLPDWSCNVEQSNKNGQINIMYLDLTGGRNSFSRDLLSDDYNVVLRLNFRLRGSARVGDIYDISVEDAVFAASDETKSLATANNSLHVKNSRIIIGE